MSKEKDKPVFDYNYERDGLWCGQTIPLIRVSGEVGAGKSLFGLGIDPNCRITSAPKTTMVWDLEGSVETYRRSLNFEWVDFGMMMADQYPQGYRLVDIFNSWRNSMLAIPRGKYRVCVIDPYVDIEAGLIEYVAANPTQFGRTKNQYEKMSSTFLWPDVKMFAKKIIFSELRSRFETIVLVAHLKNEWEGERKTGQRIAEGLDVLEKLASLHIRLDRTPPSKGKEAPRLPSGIVIKQRLIDFALDGEGEDKPILPPRLPEATPMAIRRYIKNPPDFANLAAQERMPDQAMSDDRRLMVQAGIATDLRMAAEARGSGGGADGQSILEMMQRAAQQQAAGMNANSTETNASNAAELQRGAALCTPESAAEIVKLAKEAKLSKADFVAMLGEFGVQKSSDLTINQAADMIGKLKLKGMGEFFGDSVNGAAEHGAVTQLAGTNSGN